MNPYASRYVWPEDATKNERHRARLMGKRDVEAGVWDLHEEAWVDESDPLYACSAGPHCEECGEPPREHVELAGPLMWKLAG